MPGARKAFLIDTQQGVVHRTATLRPECRIDDIPTEALRERDTEFDATMVMKTRHYAACAHCYHP